MGMRTVNDPYGDPSVLVDTVFGTSYDVVRSVANNIDYVKKVANLFDTSDTIVANVHQRYISAEGQNEFELPVNVESEDFVTVFVNGKWKNPSETFTATNTTLYFNQALAQGDVVDAMIVSGETLYILQNLKEDAQSHATAAGLSATTATAAATASANSAAASSTSANAAAASAVDAANAALDAVDAAKFTVSSVDDLLASTTTYTVGTVIFARAEGYSYEVVAAPADEVTAAGIHLRRIPASIITNDAQSATAPYFGIYPSGTPGTNHLFVRQDTTVRGDAATVFFQRNVNSDNGLSNPKALRVKTNVNVDTSQTEWAISGELDNYSNLNGTGNTSVSGVSNKYGTGSVFGGHFQAKDWNIYAAVTDVTSAIGVEINTPCVGLDHPTLNGGLGVRRVLDIIARTNEQVAGWNGGVGNSGDGEIGTGLMIRSDNTTDGYFRYGLVIDDISQGNNPNSIGTAMFVRTTGAYGIRFATTSANSAANISLEATTPSGVRASGVYSTGAFVTNDDQHVVFSTDRTKKMRWGSASGRLEFRDGANTRISFDLSAAPAIFVGGSKVLGARQPGWSIPTGTSATGSFNTATVTLEQLAQNVRGLITALHASGGSNHALIGA